MKYKIVREMILKYKDGERVYDYEMDSPVTVFNFLKNKIGNDTQENMVALHLDRRLHLNGWVVSSRGTVSETMVHPREIFKTAIIANASSIVLAHNHPSNIVTPSREDIITTNRLLEAGNIIGIPIVDHIIVSNDNYYSLKQGGHM